MMIFKVLVILFCYLVIGYLVSVIDTLIMMRMTFKTFRERKQFIDKRTDDEFTLIVDTVFWPIMLMLVIIHYICAKLEDLKSYILKQFIGENKCEKCKNRNMTYTMCDRCYNYSKFKEE